MRAIFRSRSGRITKNNRDINLTAVWSLQELHCELWLVKANLRPELQGILWKARCDSRAKQTPVAGMRCIALSELSLFFHKKKLHPQRKSVKNQLKGIIQWEALLKTTAATARHFQQVVLKPANVARQSVSQSGRLSCKCVPAGRAKLQSKASSLESTTFPCCSSSLQPTQEAAHGHKFESLTRCGFKTICMSLSLSFSLSLTPPHSVWNVPLIRPLLCSALLSFPTNSTVNENGKVFLRTCQ